MTWPRALLTTLKDLEQPVLWILGLCGLIIVGWDILKAWS